MLVALKWACCAYVVIWAIVSTIFFFAEKARFEIENALSGEPLAARTVGMAASALWLGFLWPLVLGLFAHRFFCSLRDR